MRYDLLRSTSEERIAQEHKQLADMLKSLFSLQEKHAFLLKAFFAFLLLTVLTCCAVLESPLLAAALILLLAAAWLILLRPLLALWLVFLGVGIPSLTLAVPGHTVRPLELGLIVCVALTVLLRPWFALKVPHALALLFLLVAFISFLHVPEISTTVNNFGANKRVYDLALIVLALFCGTFMSSYVKDVSSFLLAALLSNIPVYLIALAQALSIHLPTLLMPNQNPAATGDAGRLVGPFDGAATFGIYLTYPFVLSLCLWLLGSRRWERLIGFVMLCTTCLALFGAGTRSALIAAGVVLVVAFVVTKRYKLLCGIAVLAMGGFAVFPDSILKHFTHAQTSTSNRLFLWNEALKLIASHPVIGIGLEQFRNYYNQLIISPATQLNQHGISVHNQYLEWGLEGGITWLLAAVIFLLSAIIVCWYAYHDARRNAEPEKRVLYLSALLVVIASLVTSFLDVPFDNVEGAVFLCTIVGLALGHAAYRSRSAA